MTGLTSLPSCRTNIDGMSVRKTLTAIQSSIVMIVALGTESVLARTEAPRTVLVPSTSAPTIQRGIDTVSDGGVIILAPGVYRESLRVTNKSIAILGAVTENRAVEIIGLDPLAAVVRVEDRSQLTIRDIRLSDGAYGIEGVARESQARPAVSVYSSEILRCGRGIYGRFASLEAENVKIVASSHNGISLLQSGKLFLKNVDISQGGSSGIVIINKQPDDALLHLITDCEIQNNAGGGIAIIGGAEPYAIYGCTLNNNGSHGVYLLGAHHTTIDSTAMSFNNKKVNDTYGDGLRIFDSIGVTVQNSGMSFNEGIGMMTVNCGYSSQVSEVTFTNNSIMWNAIDIGAFLNPPCENLPHPYTDGGGNNCGPKACQLMLPFGQLQPPSPVEPQP